MSDGIYSALYVSNYRFAHDGVDYFAPVLPPSPFQHYWSLGVEEQFYLVWPALIIGTTWLIRLVRRRTKADARLQAETPYLVVLALVAVAVVRAVAGGHFRGALPWRSFRYPPGPGSWPPAAWWPSRPASGTDSRHELPRSRDGQGWG